MSLTDIPGVGTFADELASKAASKITTIGVAGAGAFGAVGLLAWSYGHGGISGVPVRVSDWLDAGTTSARLVILAGALLAVLLAGFLSETFVLPVLRLLEGYWAAWLEPLRSRLVRRTQRKAKRDAERLAELAEQRQDGDSDEALLVVLKRIAQRPSRTELLLPTRLGNLLRAHETRPADLYGLDPVRLWTRLWLLLPSQAQGEVSAARGRLDAAVVAWMWAVASSVWVIWAWWVLPAAVLVAWVLHRGLLVPRADTYGDMVAAAFDLYRTLLYEATRWPLPESPSSEIECGQALSRLMAYGYAETSARYADQGGAAPEANRSSPESHDE
ncbi:MAG: hypothetical protein ACOYBY_16700 [Dermatophilaceae bacterium]